MFSGYAQLPPFSTLAAIVLKGLGVLPIHFFVTRLRIAGGPGLIEWDFGSAS